MARKIEVVKIDSNVPMPVQRYPLMNLKVGESFEFPIERRDLIQTNASTIKRRKGREFTVRKVNETTARVWRVK